MIVTVWVAITVLTAEWLCCKFLNSLTAACSFTFSDLQCIGTCTLYVVELNALPQMTNSLLLVIQLALGKANILQALS